MWKVLVLLLVVNILFESGKCRLSDSSSEDDSSENCDSNNGDASDDSSEDDDDNDDDSSDDCPASANLTRGCDLDCSQRCPVYNKPTRCICPENSCKCLDDFYYDESSRSCVAYHDCDSDPGKSAHISVATGDKDCSCYPNAEPGCDSKCQRRCPSYTYDYVRCHCPVVGSCRCKKGYVFDVPKYMCVRPYNCSYTTSESDTTTAEESSESDDCETSTSGTDTSTTEYTSSAITTETVDCEISGYAATTKSFSGTPEICEMNTTPYYTTENECVDEKTTTNTYGYDSTSTEINSDSTNSDCGCDNNDYTSSTEYVTNDMTTVTDSTYSITETDSTYSITEATTCADTSTIDTSTNSDYTLTTENYTTSANKTIASTTIDYTITQSYASIESTTCEDETTTAYTNNINYTTTTVSEETTTPEIMSTATTTDTVITTDNITTTDTITVTDIITTMDNTTTTGIMTTTEVISTTAMPECSDSMVRFQVGLNKLGAQILLTLMEFKPLNTHIASPLFLNIILSVLYGRAVGKTANDLGKILNLDNYEELSCVLKKVIDCVENLSSGYFYTAAVFTLNKEYTFSDDLIKGVKQFINGTTLSHDSGEKRKTVDAINNFVATSTNGIVSNVVLLEDIATNTQLLATDVVYIKPRIEFRNRVTIQEKNFLSDLFRIQKINFSVVTEVVNYYKTDAYEMLCLYTYDGNELTVILPKSKLYGFKYMLKLIEENPDMVNEDKRKMVSTNVTLYMPIANIIDTKIDTNKVLKRLNLGQSIFEADTAQYNNLVLGNKPIGLTGSFQTVRIDYSEIIVQGNSSLPAINGKEEPSNKYPQESVKFMCTYPFIFTLTCNNTILYMGYYRGPD